MKKWYTSKTLWVNAFSFVAAVLALMVADPAFQHLAPYTVVALAFVNRITPTCVGKTISY